MVDAPQPARRRRLHIGVTGGIGSGKSALAEMLGQWGAAVIDADAVAHELTAAGGAAIDALREAFGDAMIDADGALDRARMRAAVFADPAQRARLEAILHPMIAARLGRLAVELPGPYVVFVVPLLVESLARWRARLDRIVVVDCSPEQQESRVMLRSGLPREQVRAIMRAQATREQRLAAADDVIDNSGDREYLREQARRLHDRVLEAARGI